MSLFRRRTPDERRAARRHRIWADLAMMSRDLDVLWRSNMDVLLEREATQISFAVEWCQDATALLERNNRT
jgi:hypothetical protein